MNPRLWLNELPKIQAKTLSAPLMIVVLLAMIVLPLPPFLLDLSFTFSIALSMMVLLIALQTAKPLDFISFPNVLLITTILRLSLNVASTRLVLTNGHTGTAAAGKVIESFGHFLIGGNYAVGLVVFIILTIINFVVITKGAGRIAEVSARFTLDALPGKQMSIDAEFNAGRINQEQAKQRRIEISQEADFYGAMDGASKYVRGDAIAGLLVIIVNIIGGLIVGVVQHDMSFSAAIKNYTMLAIGDGLVAQIPAIIISVAAGVVVSRVSNDKDIGSQLTEQLFFNHRILLSTALIIGSMGLIPGMPNIAFLFIALALSGLAFYVKNISKLKQEMTQDESVQAEESPTTGWQDVRTIDPLCIELGSGLLTFVKAEEKRFSARLMALRKAFVRETGFLPPLPSIVDSNQLDRHTYAIQIRGVTVAAEAIYPELLFAMHPTLVNHTLPGISVTDPAFGLPATWIQPDQREEAQQQGYTLIDPTTVLTTHLNRVMQLHAHEFLGRAEVRHLLEIAFNDSPNSKDEFVPRTITLFNFQKVLQNLLSEGLPIRDLHTIIDVIFEHSELASNPDALTESIRRKMGRAIIQHISPNDSDLQVMSIDGQLEKLLKTSLLSTNENALEPSLAETFLNMTKDATHEQVKQGATPILVVPSVLRLSLARFLRKRIPLLYVLSHDELVDAKTIRVSNIIGQRPSVISS